jgi:AcrR family transcriptional regulator
MASVTIRSRKPRAIRRQELADQLLDTIEQLLGEGESFTGISVERLVEAVGISRSTFYVYFEDKGDLLRVWLSGVRAELSEAVTGWWRLDGSSTREDLHAVLTHVVGVYQPHMPLMSTLFDAAVYDPSIRALTSEMMAANVASLRKHIQLGQKRGFIEPTLNAEEVATWLVAMEERAFHTFMRNATGTGLSRHVDAYTAIIWNALYQPTHSTR